ncbi:MarR family winged helix-turn-helix transcriptional regulator [Streptomyces sp. NPDC092296]|uniref:MarR family winged helix-turn-helix transcriptional regulator n=1 Tax=Streptomyces sp. NPDC092296 TaxID=3366012 RepID=UPI00382642F6
MPTPSDVAQAAGELRACLGPLVRRLRQVHQDGELTLSQAAVLVRLEREGPATPGALAAGEGIRAQSMSVLASGLRERGLVTRSPDPADRRCVRLSITERGREALCGARQEKAQRLARAISEGLTPAEQEQLIAAIPLLERIGRLV